jgi:predicted permease
LTALIFLTACANVGGLIAARASDRSKEVALALALGAKKRFIAQQLLSEAFIFGTVGGLIGILAAALILRLISQWRPPVDFPIILPLAIDFRIIAVSVCLAIGCALLASLVPLIRSSSIQPYEILKGGFNVHRRVRSNVTIQGAMLFVQVALCCALLLASFVSIRSLRGVMDLRLGFDPKGVIVANYNLALSQYSDDDVKRSDRTIPEEMSKLPGVIGVGIADKTPLSLDQSSLSVFDAGTTDMRLATQKFVAYEYLVSPTYFPTARTAVRMGRDLSNGDDEHAPKVAVVNSTFARLLCGSQRSCVQTYFKDASGVKLEIVGVVEDGKYATIAEQPSPAVFLPRNQVDSKSVALVVRSEPNANLSAETVRAAIRRTDPSIVVSSVGNWIDDLDIALLPARATAVIMGALGLVAIMLASSGLFSAAANTVSKRSREFGIRAALGARPFNILSAAFARLIVLVISGAIFGVAIGVAFQKVMGAIVYGAGSLDWLTITSALLAVFLLTASSVALPASRALGINPSQLLREE